MGQGGKVPEVCELSPCPATTTTTTTGTINTSRYTLKQPANIWNQKIFIILFYVPPKESGRHMADPTKHFPSNDPAKGCVRDQEEEEEKTDNKKKAIKKNNHPTNKKRAPTTVCVLHR
jgi:hypothetical protein